MLTTDSSPERVLYRKGYRFVAGVDEAGRGPLAGPVVAAAVVLPPDLPLPGVNDSKKLTSVQREKAYADIAGSALSVGIGIIDHDEIDRINILRASLKAMDRAVAQLICPVDYILVDGIHPIPAATAQMAVKHGDGLSLPIAAASIIAKVIRDRMMDIYHQHYPCYNFAGNKGYGTREHREAIRKYGYCPLHRKTFRGVKEHQPGRFYHD
jgi:ribonuclease HII